MKLKRYIVCFYIGEEPFIKIIERYTVITYSLEEAATLFRDKGMRTGYSYYVHEA